MTSQQWRDAQTQVNDSERHAAQQHYMPWSSALSYLSASPRPIQDDGEVDQARGWKVARLVDPVEGIFAGYAYGSFGVSARATCLKSRRGHSAPANGCECGFNAMKQRHDAVRLMERWRGFVLLEVELYGSIIEHRIGWRAEEQDVLSVGVPERCTSPFCRRSTEGFGRRLGRYVAACRTHMGSGGIELAVLRRKGLDVYLTEHI